MKVNTSFACIGIFTLVGCAHSSMSGMRGTVALKANEKEAYVCLGDKEVEVGQKVRFFKNECNQNTSRPGTSAPASSFLCTKVKIGEGHVTKLVNEHYSIVEPDGVVKFEEGTIVETF